MREHGPMYTGGVRVVVVVLCFVVSRPEMVLFFLTQIRKKKRKRAFFTISFFWRRGKTAENPGSYD